MSEVVMFRKGKHVYLRPFIQADAPTLQRWMNDQEVVQYLMRVFPISIREEQEWLDNQGKSKNDFALAIVTVETNEFIGSIGLHRIDWVNRNAVTGTVLGESAYWGKGYGTEAKMLLLDFAFNALDLQVIVSNVMDYNTRSLSYGKKCGYVEVGRIPKWLRRKNGERCDEVVLAVTQEQWRPLWDKYLQE